MAQATEQAQKEASSKTEQAVKEGKKGPDKIAGPNRTCSEIRADLSLHCGRWIRTRAPVAQALK